MCKKEDKEEVLSLKEAFKEILEIVVKENIFVKALLIMFCIDFILIILFRLF